MSEQKRQELYEKKKKELQRLDLDPKEYERLLKEYCKKIGF